MKIYTMYNIINCRDLGGFKGKYGTTTEGKAFRCGMPRNPCEADFNLLKQMGIKNIIDLKGYDEQGTTSSAFVDRTDFNYYNIPTLVANPALTDVNLPIWEMYRMSLEGYAGNYAEIFRLIISLKEPFLFNCFLGKDRTGLLSALLLGAAGVSEEEIISDYELSWKFIKPFVEKELRENTGLIWKQDESRLRSDRENMVNSLQYIKDTYGDIKSYLKYTGLTADEIEALGKAMI